MYLAIHMSYHYLLYLSLWKKNPVQHLLSSRSFLLATYTYITFNFPFRVLNNSSSVMGLLLTTTTTVRQWNEFSCKIPVHMVVSIMLLLLLPASSLATCQRKEVKGEDMLSKWSVWSVNRLQMFFVYFLPLQLTCPLLLLLLLLLTSLAKGSFLSLSLRTLIPKKTKSRSTFLVFFSPPSPIAQILDTDTLTYTHASMALLSYLS